MGSQSILSTSRYVDRSVARMIIARLLTPDIGAPSVGGAEAGKSSGPDDPGGAGQGEDDPVGTQRAYFFASFFRFTYAQIFFVISEGPMGVEPMTDSSVSLHPLKLIA